MPAIAETPDRRRFYLRSYRRVRRFDNGIEVFERTEPRTRTMSAGKAIQEYARGRHLPSPHWPPRERYEHRHLIAVPVPEGERKERFAVIGEYEEEGRSRCFGWVGSIRRPLPFDEARWMIAVAALDLSET